MLSGVMGILTNSVYRYILYAVVVALACAYAGYRGYKLGYQLADTERLRVVSELNAKAVLARDNADRLQREILERTEIQLQKIQSENDALETLLENNQSEAAKDPDANRPAISIDSVRRLNKINGD